jgi:D-arabinose 1-dehydrogenase-like Zn-dependent alcohol dehydrogenase
MVVVGVSQELIEASPVVLVNQSRSVAGHPSGTSQDSENTLRFAALTGVRAQIETFAMSQAVEGFERMLSGQARFRVVLTTS